jgi:hypothetical protein
MVLNLRGEEAFSFKFNISTHFSFSTGMPGNLSHDNEGIMKTGRVNGIYFTYGAGDGLV